jgi:hypothetical protein
MGDLPTDFADALHFNMLNAGPGSKGISYVSESFLDSVLAESALKADERAVRAFNVEKDLTYYIFYMDEMNASEQTRNRRRRERDD